MSDLCLNNRLEVQRQTLRDRGICVVIPTYNNAGTIVGVVERAMEQCADVIVVCDGCTDQTLELLGAMPKQPAIVAYDKNRGKGAALREGFRYALREGFAYAITLDGDGQHYPEDIGVLLKANQRHPGALIVGERKGLEGVERSRGSKFANAFSNFWFAVQTGQYLRDTQTGYRLYPLKKLKGLSLLTSRYEAELELMVFASWHGVKLVSEPVNVFYPPREERVSHFRPTKDFARITLLNMVLCLLAVVYGLPLGVCRFLLKVLRSVYSLSIFIIFTMFIMTPLVHIYLLIGKITERKKLNLHRMLNFASRFILLYHKIPGMRYTESNPHSEDYKRPAVIICNHQSHLDLMPLLAQTEKIIILTADWVWNNPLYRFTIRNAEFLPASRGVEVIMPQLRSLVERGYSIAIYPEGTRSLDCSIGRFHKGAFYVAQELGVDILPLVLYGTGKALPKHGRLLNKWPAHLEIDARITPAQMKSFGQTLQEQASSMRKYYKRRYTEIANRVEQDV
ncbi:MAG: glycosyltransferase [Rikenellaceae bacterium]|nr:glycosyltransferase [Rikenellaceae bacterium]